jgi:uncharacterized OB-fold protein
VPDALSAPFWDGTAAGHLVLARCGACRAFVYPPAPVCPACGATDAPMAHEQIGRGAVLRSWTVVRQPFLPGFDELVPYVLVDAELDDAPGVRLIGRLLDGGDPPALALGAALSVVFERLDDGSAVPAFARPDQPAAS